MKICPFQFLESLSFSISTYLTKRSREIGNSFYIITELPTGLEFGFDFRNLSPVPTEYRVWRMGGTHRDIQVPYVDLVLKI